MLMGAGFASEATKALLLSNAFVELTRNSMKQFALFVTTKQSAYNFSGPPQEGPAKIFFARFAREPGPPINIFTARQLCRALY